jgi:hypothetical protein
VPQVTPRPFRSEVWHLGLAHLKYETLTGLTDALSPYNQAKAGIVCQVADFQGSNLLEHTAIMLVARFNQIER